MGKQQWLDDEKKFIRFIRKLNQISKDFFQNYFSRYFIYSQGLPLLINIYILIVDEVGQTYVENHTCGEIFPQKHLPNMGVFGCFLDNGALGEGSSYFGHPIFIYFQSFMLVSS